MDFRSGIIAANSKIDVGIMFNPTNVGNFDVILDVIAKEKNPEGITKIASKKLISQKCAMKIKAEGNYPSLKIVDVRNDEISVATLWENFQINKINHELTTDLNQDE